MDNNGCEELVIFQLSDLFYQHLFGMRLELYFIRRIIRILNIEEERFVVIVNP